MVHLMSGFYQISLGVPWFPVKEANELEVRHIGRSPLFCSVSGDHQVLAAAVSENQPVWSLWVFARRTSAARGVTAPRQTRVGWSILVLRNFPKVSQNASARQMQF